MKKIIPIAGINLLVLLVYSLLIHFNANGSERGLSIMIESAFVIGLHVFLSLGIGLANYSNNKSFGKAWLLSSGIVLLVGFSTCLGSASV